MKLSYGTCEFGSRFRLFKKRQESFEKRDVANVDAYSRFIKSNQHLVKTDELRVTRTMAQEIALKAFSKKN